MAPIEVIPTADGWKARADGQPIGLLRTITRPDGKTFLSTRDCRDDAYDPLITHAVAGLRRRVFVTVAEDAARPASFNTAANTTTASQWTRGYSGLGT